MEDSNPNPSSQATRQPSTVSYSPRILQTLKTNLLSFHSPWGELNGAMGDLGTYIPIVLALTLARDLDLGTTLIFTGVYNAVTGLLYGVPMPVQPMKSIAAVAISSPGFGVPEVMAAGICTGAVLLVLGVTGLMRFAYNLVPLSVVRGIQLAQGLSFALSAVKYVRKVQDFSKSKSTGSRPWLGLDGLVLAIVCACFIVIVNGAGQENGEDQQARDGNGTSNVLPLQVDGESSSRRRRRWRKIASNIPTAFIIFILGVVLAFIRKPKLVHGIKFGPSSIHVVRISREAWREGFIKGTIPQLPLSILNSVIAVCKLSYDLFPQRSEFSPNSVSVTVGLMNLVGCWFGAMPCCHGAGGLAGQYKFGGRTGGCVAMLGAAKLVLGLALGSSLVTVLDQFPVGVLGVLLLFAGIELAMASRDMGSKEESFVMLICTAVSLVGSSAALGFLCGMVVYCLLRLRDLSLGHVKAEGQSCSDVWMRRMP